MHLLYLDASGTPEDINCSTYVLLGLCIHEDAWHKLEAEVATVRARYELPGVPMEFHAKDFCTLIREQSKVPDFAELAPRARHDAVKGLLKRRELLPFVHLTRAERTQLFTDLLDLVGAMDGVRLFAEAVNKSASRLTEPVNLVRDAFAQVVSRFDRFLRYVNTRYSSHGMLIFDHEPTYREMLHREFVHYRLNGHPWGRVEYVIEQPFFVDSASVSAVQLADICAYAVRRHIEHPTQAPELANMNRILHKFDRSGDKLHGIRHYCPPGSCTCRICQERGHA